MPFYRFVQSCGMIQMLLHDVCEKVFRISWLMKGIMNMGEKGEEEARIIIEKEFLHAEARVMGEVRRAKRAWRVGPNIIQSNNVRLTLCLPPLTLCRFPPPSLQNLLSIHKFLGLGTGGPTFGGGDIAFCALSGWVLRPVNFTNGAIDGKFFKESNFDAKVNGFNRKLMLSYPRASRHVNRCYHEHRR